MYEDLDQQLIKSSPIIFLILLTIPFCFVISILKILESKFNQP